ncbi:MAG: UPF0175 family protein [Candidatus Magnetoovum sp. WYHC-5]|nr:UPF0175 family protein [Candidatus Magnetoovum sp. WYHC-5]
MPRQITFTFPSNLPEESFNNPEFQKKSKEFIIIELLREGVISQGKASELLEINRYDFLNLMTKYNIPAIDMTDKELEQELNQDIFKEEIK